MVIKGAITNSPECHFSLAIIQNDNIWPYKDKLIVLSFGNKNQSPGAKRLRLGNST